MQTPESFNVRVVKARLIAPGVRELVLEREGGVPFSFDPGQWVNLVLPVAGEPIKRAYSIASAPDGSPRFELAVTRVTGGPGSELLHEIAEGAELRALGPHGLFTRPAAEDTPCLFVATGTGVTPFRSMLQAALRAGGNERLWLLFGARHEEDILYQEEFEGWAREHPRVRYEVTLSQPGETWKGRRGYVQTHVPELWRALEGASGAAPHVYVCGLDRMVKTVKDLARNELGADRKHVHVERYD